MACCQYSFHFPTQFGARTLFFVHLTTLWVSQLTVKGNCRKGALWLLLCLCCCYSHSCHCLLALINNNVQLQVAPQLITCTLRPCVNSVALPSVWPLKSGHYYWTVWFRMSCIFPLASNSTFFFPF